MSKKTRTVTSPIEQIRRNKVIDECMSSNNGGALSDVLNSAAKKLNLSEGQIRGYYYGTYKKMKGKVTVSESKVRRPGKLNPLDVVTTIIDKMTTGEKKKVLAYLIK